MVPTQTGTDAFGAWHPPTPPSAQNALQTMADLTAAEPRPKAHRPGEQHRPTATTDGPCTLAYGPGLKRRLNLYFCLPCRPHLYLEVETPTSTLQKKKRLFPVIQNPTHSCLCGKRHHIQQYSFLVSMRPKLPLSHQTHRNLARGGSGNELRCPPPLKLSDSRLVRARRSPNAARVDFYLLHFYLPFR